MQTKELPLRDIHLPEAVSWWPLAPGWWLALGLLLSALVAFAVWHGGRRSRLARRTVLEELGVIEDAYAREADGQACAQALSRLLRRIALLLGDDAAAHSTGAALKTVLAPLAKAPFPDTVLELVREAPYSPTAAAAIDAERFRAATVALRAWLAGLRVPRPVKPVDAAL